MNKISFEDGYILSCELYRTLCGQEGVELYLSIAANKVSIYLTKVEIESLSKLIEKGFEEVIP